MVEVQYLSVFKITEIKRNNSGKLSAEKRKVLRFV